VTAVNRALGRLRADGTLGRLARSWLGLDPARLRVLR
jgi:ABC-type amino acid transport substrate-binding protein